MARNQYKHPVFLLDAETNGYGVMRSLRKHGIKTYAFMKPGFRFEQYSRFPEKVFHLTGGYKGYYDVLTMAAKPFKDHKPVLILTTDLYLDFVREYYHELKEHFIFEIPPHDIIKTFLEKDCFNTLAAQLNVKMPFSIDIDRGTNTDDLLKEISFPVMLKPKYRDAKWVAKYPYQKLFVASNAQELNETCHKLFELVDTLIVQEWVPGPDSNIYYCLAYITPEGKVLSHFCGRKIHQIPILLGSTASAEVANEPAVANEALRILTQRGNYGFCSVEFKKHNDTGEFYVIEPTVGRINAQEFTSTLGGVNIVRDAYLHMVKAEKITPDKPISKLYYIDELSELRACFDYHALNKFKWSTYFAKLRHKRVRFMYLNFKDPVVSLLVFAAIIKHTVRHLKMGKSRSYLQKNGTADLMKTFSNDVY